MCATVRVHMCWLYDAIQAYDDQEKEQIHNYRWTMLTVAIGPSPLPYYVTGMLCAYARWMMLMPWLMLPSGPASGLLLQLLAIHPRGRLRGL